MLSIEKQISNFVEQQFPFFLQEEGPIFIEFVKQYYMWMEGQQIVGANTVNGVLYDARRIPEYRDIDATTDQFLVYFKEKYLKNIQFNTAASLRRMTKHSLDLYRSKGTSRAIDLMFKVVFDTPAEVYLPGDDLFKLSSGDYYQHRYLEVVPAPSNILYVGKEIVGLQSDAIAFVEKLTRKKVKGTFIEVFTISSIHGNFITGEYIKTLAQSTITNNPKIIGSLTNVAILSGSRDFAVGDIVNIDSTQGTGAKGRVTSISNVTGLVDFNLLNGGFGFTNSPEILASDKVFRVANVTTDRTFSITNYFNDYDLISESQFGVDVYNITGTDGQSLSNFVGEHFFTYYANGDIKGEAVLQDFNTGTSNTNGQAFVTLLSGNVNCTGATSVNAYFNLGNTISANIGPLGIVDLSATANIVGVAANVVLAYSNSLPFSVNELVYQVDQYNRQTANGIIQATVTSGITGTITTSNNNGVFDYTRPIYSNTSGRTANLTNITVDVGVNNIRGFSQTVNNAVLVYGTSNVSVSNTVSLFPFMAVSGNGVATSTYITKVVSGSPNNTVILNSTLTANATSNITFTTSGGQFFGNTDNVIKVKRYEGDVYTTGTILVESTGALASFLVANTLGNQETIEINTDYITPKASVAINANNYNFSPYVSSNSSTVIFNALNFSEKIIGTILNLTGINSGEEYNFPPIVNINENIISQYAIRDVVLSIANTTALFFTNEIVRQPNTGAAGVVKSGNSTSLSLRLINFENSFSNTAANVAIVGSGSGTIANVLNVLQDINSNYMGKNSVVSANVITTVGTISALEIVDSGYGYQHREYGSFSSQGGDRVGTIEMLLGNRTETDAFNIGHQGHSLGYYRNMDGFLSGTKKLYDAYYYQDYSYEVRSSVTLDKYEAMLKQLLHVAGTVYFANTVTSSAIPVSSVALPSLDEYNFTVDSNTITVDSMLYTTDTTFILGYTG